MTCNIAQYHCLACEHEWEQRFGPSEGWDDEGKFVQPHQHSAKCPACGSLYFKWTNYQQLFGENFMTKSVKGD